MDDKELDNFVLTFKSLWKSGYDVHLDIDSHAGQAWVGLRLRLGQAQEPGRPFAKGNDSPCKQRRRAKRAEERTLKGEKPSNDVVEKEITEAEEAKVPKNLNKVLENEVEKLSDAQIETEKVQSAETNEHLDDCETAEDTEIVKKDKEDVTEEESKLEVTITN